MVSTLGAAFSKLHSFLSNAGRAHVTSQPWLSLDKDCLFEGPKSGDCAVHRLGRIP